MDYKGRRSRLRNLLRSASADAMLVMNRANVRYLTGFTGDDSYLLVTTGEEAIISDPRFEQQIDEECPGLQAWIRKPGEGILAYASEKMRSLDVGRLVVEPRSMTIAEFDSLTAQQVAGEYIKGGVTVEELREIKDADEQQVVRRAVSMAERVFTALRAQLSSRQTERELANWIEYQLRSMGADGCSFSPIVAVGSRAALPHATPGLNTIGSASFVLVDWGARLDGYCSDLTRVLVTSKIPAKFLKAYQAVLSAQTAAISVLRPGISVAEVDRVARDAIASAGMGKRFNHGLGHGIGLDIHEAPRVGQSVVPNQAASRKVAGAESASGKSAGGKTAGAEHGKRTQERVLQAGMVITIEPGVYFPEWGGVRIEDDVLITPTGYEVLSSLGRELDENRVELLA